MKASQYEYSPFIHKLWPTPSLEAYRVAPTHAVIYTNVRKTNLPNYLSAKIEIPSQINCDAWDRELEGYEYAEVATFLRYGWPGFYTALDLPTLSKSNHPGATAYPRALDCSLRRRQDSETCLVSFDEPPFTNWFQTSPLMSVEKKDSDERRVIIDLSFPGGHSVNDGVLKNHFKGSPPTYKLPTITDPATLVAHEGPGTYLWKTDLPRAYRQLRRDPLDCPLMGIAHGGKYYADLCPSFGCWGSSAAQQRVSSAACHLMCKRGHKVLAYVDDFCGVHSSFEQAVNAFAVFEELCAELGLKIAPEKSAFPSTKTEWLGFHLDTLAMKITLPPEKLSEVIAISTTWKEKSRASRKEIQMLVGKLNHVALCIIPARRFMSRILALLRTAPSVGTINPFNPESAWRHIFRVF